MKRPSDGLVELILFDVAGRLHAIDSAYLQEVVQSTSPSPLPFVPDYVDGLVNVNGSIIPQVDLAALLYGQVADAQDESAFHSVLILDFSGMTLAVRAGQVQELLKITGEDIHHTPDVAADIVEEGEESGTAPELPPHIEGWVEYFPPSGPVHIPVIDAESLREVIRYNQTAKGKPGFLGKVEERVVEEERLLKYLVVDVCGSEFAFALDDVLEIVSPELICPQPGAPELVQGVALVREKPLLVLGLHELLGEGRPESAADSVRYVVVVRDSDMVCGISISRLCGLEMVPERQVKTDQERQITTLMRQNGTSLIRVIRPEVLLDQRMRLLAGPFLPSYDHSMEEARVPQMELLRFEMEGSAYGIEVGSIRRVVSDKLIEPLLSEQGSLIGTMELEGKVLPVVDLYAQLGHKGGESRHRECIVVNDGEEDWAVAINETDQIVKIDETRVNAVAEGSSQYVAAFSSFGGKLLTILDIAAICRDNRIHADQ